ILFGRPDATERDIAETIRLSYFEKDLEMLPDGLDTLVGEKGVALSGGQKQRISIARALVKNPEILILDDSLSAVDAKTEAKIIENIQAERKGKTTIITTHRLSA
ncbi:ATP-binding cassette domain-containing protein, partial [Microvirga sp. 3-52]|nr:ATP-binding cassette domain-containing protein [Microvirga sp. 3-52]